MAGKKFNIVSPKSRVLIAPLDWGLGHATRCIPLIRAFRNAGYEVVIAAENALVSLLSNEFQQLTIIPVKGYRVRYVKRPGWLPIKMLLQVPLILISIYQEHQWLKKVVKKHSIGLIISDNRFGLYHSGIPCVYITHQLLIKTGNRFTEKILQQIHFQFISRFSYCWVPDFEGTHNIAGDLSHPINRPANVKYIGGLSRFEKKEGLPQIYDLAVIISGPEPQRTIFETLLLAQLQHYTGRSLLVRGLPGAALQENEMEVLNKNPRLVIRNHLTAPEMNDAILQSELVICRSGYTTLMDLIKLGKKAVLVPTPGQTEQEYLAKHLMKQNFFLAVAQKGFLFNDVLKRAAVFPFQLPAFDMEQYKKIVVQLSHCDG